MSEFLSLYCKIIDNLTPDQQIEHLLYEISSDQELIKMFEEDIAESSDPTRILDCRNNIKCAEDSINSMKILIDRIRSGKGKLEVSISNIETNL